MAVPSDGQSLKSHGQQGRGESRASIFQDAAQSGSEVGSKGTRQGLVVPVQNCALTQAMTLMHVHRCTCTHTNTQANNIIERTWEAIKYKMAEFFKK